MFRTMSMKSRFLISGIISVAAILILSSFAVYSLWQSELELERQISATQASRHVLRADMMHDAVEASVFAAVLAGRDGAQTARADARAEVAERDAIFRQELSALQAMDLEDDVRGLLETALPQVDQFLLSAGGTTDAALNGGAGLDAALSAFQLQSEQLGAVLGPLGDRIVSNARATAVSARAHDMMLLYSLLAVSAALILLSIYNARKMMLNIVRPVGRLRDALQEVAEGEFGIRVSDRMRSDDFGEIAKDIDRVSARVIDALEEQNALREESEQVIERLRSGLQRLSNGDLSDRIGEKFNSDYDALRVNYNETVDKLNELMSDVVQAGARIQQQSAEIQAASDDLSSRTESQAATLEETAAALEQMTASVNSSAHNAQQVQDVVNTARKEVERSGEVVEGAIAAMNEIEQSSHQISQIIGVIDDIAFQTNLLALNAGVEAARAGEVGRGFAVVASEVRALAQRSSEAANEIKTLISASTAHVEDGVRKVDGAGQALTGVVSQVGTIAELVSGISSESGEQAQGLNEINSGVSQLDQVTQQNASMVVQAGSAIRAMNAETVGLNRLVRQFVLRGGGNAVEAAAAETRADPVPAQPPRPVAEAEVEPLADAAWEDFNDGSEAWPDRDGAALPRSA